MFNYVWRWEVSYYACLIFVGPVFLSTMICFRHAGLRSTNCPLGCSGDFLVLLAGKRLLSNEEGIHDATFIHFGVIWRRRYHFKGTEGLQQYFCQRQARQACWFGHLQQQSVNNEMLSRVELQLCSDSSVKMALVLNPGSPDLCVHLLVYDVKQV